eukprot:m.52080 g.52080  ORF g.52080 m.52080 type:complete len:125 (+) comp10773_c0_seq1:102-476(+)
MKAVVGKVYLGQQEGWGKAILFDEVTGVITKIVPAASPSEAERDALLFATRVQFKFSKCNQTENIEGDIINALKGISDIYFAPLIIPGFVDAHMHPLGSGMRYPILNALTNVILSTSLDLQERT